MADIPHPASGARVADFWRIVSAASLPFLEQLSEYSCDRVFRPLPPVSTVQVHARAKNGLSVELLVIARFFTHAA